MPPKKKGGKAKKGKKKGKKKQDGAGGELTVEELYKRTSQEVGSLKERLSEQKQYARHSRAREQLMRDRMLVARGTVEEEKISKRDITCDMTRQYKTMQVQMESRIEYLEVQVRKLQAGLEESQAHLLQVTAERDRLQREKEEQVAVLNAKLHSVERSYETILQEALDSMAVKMEAARGRWSSESHLLEQRAQQVLTEFGRGLHVPQEGVAC